MDTKHVLFKWFDKLILLAALAFVAWAASRVNPPQEAEKLRADARRLIDAIGEKIRSDKPPKLEKLKQAKVLKDAYEPIPEPPVPPGPGVWYPPRDMVHLHKVMNTLEGSHEFDHPIRGEPQVRPFSSKSPGNVTASVSPDRKTLKFRGVKEGWVKIVLYDTTGQRHVVVVEVEKFVPDPKVYQPRKPEVALKPGSKTVMITWEPPDSIDERARIQGYYVYRKKEGAKDLERLPLVPVDATKGKGTAGGTYEDSNTAFDTTYVYHVTSYSSAAKPAESPPSASATVTIPSDIKFVLRGASSNKAQIKVYKWRQSEGWNAKTFFVSPGEAIGEDWTGSVFKDGKLQRNVHIDYRTGCFLVDIDTRAAYRVVMFDKPRDMLSQQIVYLSKHGGLEEKWQFEPDAAPWERFRETAPEAAEKKKARKAPKVKKGRPGEPIEDALKAPDAEEERKRADEGVPKPPPPGTPAVPEKL